MTVESFVEVHVEIDESGVCDVYRAMSQDGEWVPFVEMKEVKS